MERVIKSLEHGPALGVVRDTEPHEATAVPRVGQPVRVKFTQTRTVNPAPEDLYRNRVLCGLEEASVRDAYKMLRTQVLQRMRANGWSALAVTSATPGEGKTLTAVNLAISLARDANHSVLLVDLDLRRPSVSRCFGYDPEYGIRDYLLDDVPLSDILFTPGIERFAVLPAGRALMESSELLTAPKMAHLARELKSRYDGRIVIYDLPPMLVADDFLAFAPRVDAALLVIEEGKTRKSDLSAAMEAMRDIPVVGTVLNKSFEKQRTYAGYS